MKENRLIKIGDGYFRADQIAGIVEYRFAGECRGDRFYIYLASGETAIVYTDRSDIDRAVKIINGEDDEPGCTVVSIGAAEKAELQRAYHGGMSYIARDADGKVYAFDTKPTRDGAYWVCTGACGDWHRLSGCYDGIVTADDDPIEIEMLLNNN